MKLTRKTPPRNVNPALSDAVLAGIVGSAMDGIIAIDEQQRIVLFNNAAEHMFGRAAGELLGQPIDTLLPERFRGAHRLQVELFGRARTTRRAMGNLGAIHGLRANGEEFPIEASISQTDVEQRRILTVILRDVSERRRVEEALHASTTLVNSIVDSSYDAIIGKHLDGTIISWNGGAQSLFGYSSSEVLGKSILMLFPPERTEEEPAIMARILRGERVEHFETERIRKDGGRIDVSVTISPLRDSAGTIIGASKIARDITERKRAQEKVVRLSRTHAVLSGINSLIVRSRDRRQLLESACRIAVEQGNFAAAWIGLLDAEGEGLHTVAWAGFETAPIAPDDRALNESGLGLVERAIAQRSPAFSNDLATDPHESLTQRLRAALERRYGSRIALPLVVADKPIGAMELFAREPDFFDDAELRLLTEIAGDVSFALEHIEQEEELRYLAYHDPLTGLANRVLLFDRLEQAIRSARHSGQRVALLFGDIKGFRQINETWGRQAGDQILRELAMRLRKLSPEPENVARISADYCAGVVSGLKSATDLGHLVEHSFTTLLSEAYHVAGTEIRVFTRAGIAVFPEDGSDAESLFRNAEAAHRRAKETGQRYQFYEPAINAHVARTLLLESKLKAAEERQQFLLHYQPIVNAEGRLVALEALLRWQDPDEGIVCPDSFIPILESTGLIVEVGQWVIRQALAQQKFWEDGGIRAPRVSVNISAVQLLRPDFIERVRDSLSSGSRTIDFEITESVLMRNIDDNIQKLQSLRDHGISIAIDDFGIGYSSLSYLTRLPINTLKIDRAFVSKMTTDAQSMAVVSAIISLARTLKLKVVAEGVETEEQARFLRLLGCDELQGYLFGRPSDAQQIAKLLTSDVVRLTGG